MSKTKTSIYVNGTVEIKIKPEPNPLGRGMTNYTFEHDEIDGRNVISGLHITEYVSQKEYDEFIEGVNDVPFSFSKDLDKDLYKKVERRHKVVYKDGYEREFYAQVGFSRDKNLEFEIDHEVVERLSYNEVKALYIENNGEWVYVTGEDDFDESKIES